METRAKDLPKKENVVQSEDGETVSSRSCRPKGSPDPNIKYPPVVFRPAPLHYDAESRMYFFSTQQDDLPQNATVVYVPESNNSISTFFKSFFETKQIQICNHIKNIADENIQEQKITMDSFPKENWFGHQFIIGAEMKNTSSESSRYYRLFFIDDISDPVRCMRGMKNGILEIDARGNLIILNDYFHPMRGVNSSFIFKDNELELHSNGWLEHQKTSSCAIS